MRRLKYIFATIYVFLYSAVVFAQDNGNGLDKDAEGDNLGPGPVTVVVPPTSGGGGQTSSPIHGEGAPATPIDTYEWLLLAVAVLLIVGYYVYSNRNKRIANS